MSKEAKEFLEDNNHDFHKDDLFVSDDATGDTYAIDVDIPNLMEEYFAFRLGKLLTDGDAKLCKKLKSEGGKC